VPLRRFSVEKLKSLLKSWQSAPECSPTAFAVRALANWIENDVSKRVELEKLTMPLSAFAGHPGYGKNKAS